MKQMLSVFSLLIMLFASLLCAGDYASWDDSQLNLDNGLVKRVIQFNPQKTSVSTSRLAFCKGDTNFVQNSSNEFYFECDDLPISGMDGWTLKNIKKAADEHQGNGATVTLERNRSPRLVLEITYLLYPQTPVIRKKLAVVNMGDQDINLEAVDVENLEFFDRDGRCYSMTNYARHKVTGPYPGNWHDPAVALHHVEEKRGLVLGNETPGVIKRISTFTDAFNFSIGLTHADQEYAFRKWLEPQERWTSPWTFLCLYRDTDDPFQAIEGPVQDFTRRYMGIRLATVSHFPSLAYNHWKPYRATVDDSLLRKLTDAAAECGIEEITLDAGWYTIKDTKKDVDWAFKCGDYVVNPEKYPNGLESVYSYIKQKGLRRGLWLSLAMASKYSAVYKEHPDWFILDKNGQPMCVHGIQPANVTACMTTGWADYIRDVIAEKVKALDLNYVKLDLAIATSAYMYDRDMSGCHATNHPGHRDQNDSYLPIYRSAWQVFDDLHRQFPELFIDCTYETMGASHLIDYDMCKHAEGNWLSNIYERGPVGALQARNLAWLVSPTLPASACVIGNLQLDDPYYRLHIRSVAGVFPIVLGEILAIAKDDQAWIKSMSHWLHELQTKHNYMLFRQDLAGFGEPHEGQWDGYQRINTETQSGGLVGVFRHGALETERQVFVRYLHPDKTYLVRREISNEIVAELSGKELMQKGFRVKIDNKYDGVLFEVIQK